MWSLDLALVAAGIVALVNVLAILVVAGASRTRDDEVDGYVP